MCRDHMFGSMYHCSTEPTATTESPTQSTTATPLECTSEPTTKETTGVRSDPVSGGETEGVTVKLIAFFLSLK